MCNKCSNFPNSSLTENEMQDWFRENEQTKLYALNTNNTRQNQTYIQ